MTKDENIWTGIKFILLLCFSVTLMYILLCKYIIHIPDSQTEVLVNEIDESEAILCDQQKTTQQFDIIKADIDSLNFEIQQEQRTGEIKARISQLQDGYKRHDQQPRYLYGVQAYKFLQGYFDIRENLGYTLSDNKLIEQDLEKIKANI